VLLHLLELLRVLVVEVWRQLVGVGLELGHVDEVGWWLLELLRRREVVGLAYVAWEEALAGHVGRGYGECGRGHDW